MTQPSGRTPERHRLNRRFAWSLPGGPRRLLTEQQIAQYDRAGYFVLEGALDEQSVERVVTELDTFETARVEELRANPRAPHAAGEPVISDAAVITFTANLSARSLSLRRFARDALFLNIAHDLVGPDVRLFWDQAVYKKPEGAREFPWHQDNGYTYVEPQGYVTCWIALTEATENNGCPWVMPGLHRLGTLAHHWTDTGFQCEVDPATAVSVPVAAGGVVVFSSLTPHRTGPNLTTSTRKAYILQYGAAEACALRLDDETDEIVREPQDNPDYQFLVLEKGEVVPE
jgi:phytanoyl-CoA hydroxylase